MKIAIVDDLKLDAEQLSHLILSYMKEHRIPTAAPEIFPNGETFLASFTVGSFDIVFLDIYMDGLSGMETAQKLRALDASCRIVFVTTSPDFAVDSYDVNAAFYLLKPVTMEHFSVSYSGMCSISQKTPPFSVENFSLGLWIRTGLSASVSVPDSKRFVQCMGAIPRAPLLWRFI